MNVFALKSWKSLIPDLNTVLDGKPFTREQTAFLSFLLALQLACFKLFYPFPDFFGDSYNYIDAASHNLNVNIWPIGYSKFLLAFHWLTHSAFLLILFQYFCLEAAYFYLYQTIIRFIPTGKRTRAIILLFFFCSPLNLYISNYVSTEALFLALSLVWLTELLRITYKPSYHHILILSVAFAIAFTFRYNAMYYPVIATVAFLISKQHFAQKVIGIILGPLLILPFVIFSSHAVKQLSGTAQFPPIYGGWQWGNNALYFREHIQEDTNAIPTPQMAELDQMARNYFRTVSPKYRELAPYVGNFFIQQRKAPLRQYIVKHFRSTESIEAWAKAAPLYKDYGIWLIKRHPFSFARYYLLVNTKNYLLPPLEKLACYNLDQPTMDSLATFWFDFPDNEITSILPRTFQGTLLILYPFLFLFLNFYFCRSLFFFSKQKGFRSSPTPLANSIALITLLLLTNFSFSIFANVIAFRYQLFPMVVLLAFALILDNYTEQFLEEKSPTSISATI
jgi:hypothetical protein